MWCQGQPTTPCREKCRAHPSAVDGNSSNISRAQTANWSLNQMLKSRCRAGWDFVTSNTEALHKKGKVKVKFSRIRYQAWGPELIPVYRQSARKWLSHPPGLLSTGSAVTSVAGANHIQGSTHPIWGLVSSLKIKYKYLSEWQEIAIFLTYSNFKHKFFNFHCKEIIKIYILHVLWLCTISSRDTELRHNLFLCGNVVVNKRHVLQRTLSTIPHTTANFLQTYAASVILHYVNQQYFVLRTCMCGVS